VRPGDTSRQLLCFAREDCASACCRYWSHNASQSFAG
jgi:hypothetical protein